MKRIVITGGTTGIGRSTAELFLEKGYLVYSLDIKRSESLSSDRYLQYLCDVSNIGELQSTCEKILEHARGEIDVLFCNAGIHHFGNIEQTSVEVYERVVNTNIRGTFFTLQFLLPSMKKQQSGSIILMGSDQSFVGKNESAVYGLTKGAIGQLTKSTALDCAPFNIRVNCVCPGTIETPLYHNAVKTYCDANNIDPNDVYEGLRTAQPIPRVGSPIEVANVVAFLASEQASFMTGSLVPIDGGYIAK
jgi:NAD(P)-dependent dehydrogenase (short-subunit alcohol dehydrogenase family)